MNSIFTRNWEKRGGGDGEWEWSKENLQAVAAANMVFPEMWCYVDKAASHWHTANIMCDN